MVDQNNLEEQWTVADERVFQELKRRRDRVHKKTIRKIIHQKKHTPHKRKEKDNTYIV
ncbi:MAG: hypothetical protein FWH37_02920 [Candidatus Bathyarchaeota archaeon]|nr:hypothetical protein [Candidatus Termiticorpusculum sp.]